MCRWPRTVIAIAMLATALSGWYAATNIKIATDTRRMLSEDLQYRQIDFAFDRAFPKETHQLLIVVEGENPDLVADAAELLTEVLQNRPDLFETVFDPSGDPFFRANGLLYPTIDDLYDLTDRLSEAQPFLGALWRDRSMRGLFDMLKLAVDETGSGETGEKVDIARVLNAVANVTDAEVENRFARLSWMSLMTGQGRDTPTRRFITAQPVLDYGRLLPAGDAIDAVRSIAADLGFDGARDVQIRMTGSVALKHDELKSVTIGMSTAGALSLTLVLALLLIALRSPRTVAAALITLIVGLILTAAFAVAAVGELNMISVAFAVLFIGLSVDFSIHYALRYREEWEHRHASVANLEATARAIGGALSLSAIAAAIGFVSFVPTDYTGLAELGIIAAAGMVIALFANLTLLPALILVINPRFVRAVRWDSDKKNVVGHFVRRHARVVALTGGLLAVGSAALLPSAQFDFDPLNLKDPESPSVSTLLDLMADDPRFNYSALYLADTLEEADQLAEKVDALATVAEVRTLSSFVPTDQNEKREIVETLALVLEPGLTAPRVLPPTPDETRAALGRLISSLEALDSASDIETSQASKRLATSLRKLEALAVEDPNVMKRLEGRLLAGLSTRLEALRSMLRPGLVDIESLPIPIRERWLAEDGRARLEIYPAASVHQDRDALRAFLKDVRSEIPDATGAPVAVYEGGRVVVRAFLEAAAIAVVAISVLLLALLRSVRVTLVIFAPLVLAALLTVAGSVLFGIPFNFANVIVLPLLFGLGVAGSLHIVLRQRAQREDDSVLSTSTPRAVLFSTLTTIASFVSLNLSEHPGTASMGSLLAIALVLTMMCTLIFLPAMMVIAGIRGTSDSTETQVPSGPSTTSR